MVCVRTVRFAVLLAACSVAVPLMAQEGDLVPPVVDVHPYDTTFTSTTTSTITIYWCDETNLRATSRRIYLGTTNVTSQFTYVLSSAAGCGEYRVSTGTVSGLSGTMKLLATIEDGAFNEGRDSSFYTYQQPTFGVSVTPDGQTVTGYGRGSNTQQFTVTNTGNTRDTFNLTIPTCNGSGVSACSAPASIALNAGASGTVTVTYQADAGGSSGTITLRATHTAGTPSDDGSVNVSVQWATHLTVDATLTNNDHQKMALCATACFAVTQAVSTVPYYSLGAPRNVTLVYHGDRASARPFVYADVSVTAGASTLVRYELEVREAGVALPWANGDPTTIHFAPPATPTTMVRLGGQLNLSGRLTGVYPVTLIVRAVYTDHSETREIPTRIAVVEERRSSIARGWTVAGVQRLYLTDSAALITEGEGSMVAFLRQNGFFAPAGEYSVLRTLTVGGATVYERAYPDSTKVWFRGSGAMQGFADSTADRFGTTVRFEYDAVTLRLSKIFDPHRRDPGSQRSYIALSYASYGLQSIREPGPDGSQTGGRVTQFSVASDSTLRAVTDPDGVSSGFGYDGLGRLETAVNRRGDTTRFVYDVAWKLARIDLPKVAIDAGNGSTTLQSLSLVYRGWQIASMATAPTSTTNLAPALLPDSAYARLTDAEGHVTTYTADRWGQPVKSRDLLGRLTTIVRSGPFATQITHPDGRIDSFTYQGPLLATSTLAGRPTTTYTYGAWSQVTKVQNPNSPTTDLYLGPMGRVDSVSVAGKKTRYFYDALQRDTLVKDAGGHATRTHYEAKFGQADSVIAPGSRSIRMVYDAYGRDSVSIAVGQPAKSTLYDVLNRPRQVFDGVNPNPTTFVYDDPIFLTKIRDAAGTVFRTDVNALGWKTADYDPADTVNWSRKIQYRYNRDGSVTSTTNRRGQVIDIRYDGAHRPVSRRDGLTPRDSFAYGAGDTVVVAINDFSVDTVITSRTGAVRTRIVRLGAALDKRFEIGYRQLLGTRTDSIGVSSTGTSMVFAKRRFYWNPDTWTLDSIGINAAHIKFTRNAELLPDSVHWPGATSSQMYTSLHQPATVSFPGSQALNDAFYRSYRYDTLARIVEVGEKAGQTQTTSEYAYDGLGQLRRFARWQDVWVQCRPTENAEDYGTGCFNEAPATYLNTRGYAYDPAGNQVRDTDSLTAASTLGSYPVANRLTTWGDTSYTYDLDGNRATRTTPSGIVTYAWRADGKLSSVTVGSVTTAYAYNALGRLVRRSKNGVVDRYYLWEGDQLLAELDATASNRVREYVSVGELDQPLAFLAGANDATLHYYMQDAVGNMVGVLVGSSVEQRAAYDPWGKLIYQTSTSADTTHVRWKGALWEGDGVDLYYMRARWYDPNAKRFLSEDPLGVAGGINNYVFGGNEPVNRSDPTGLLYLTSRGVCSVMSDTCGGSSFEAVRLEGVSCFVGGSLSRYQRCLLSIGSYLNSSRGRHQLRSLTSLELAHIVIDASNDAGNEDKVYFFGVNETLALVGGWDFGSGVAVRNGKAGVYVRFGAAIGIAAGAGLEIGVSESLAAFEGVSSGWCFTFLSAPTVCDTRNSAGITLSIVVGGGWPAGIVWVKTETWVWGL